MTNFDSDDSAMIKHNPDESVFQPHHLDLMGKFHNASPNLSSEPQTVLQRIFPNQYERLARNEELKMAATHYEYRRKALEVIGQGLCEDLKIRCKAYLAQNEAKLDRQTKEILVNELLSLKEHCEQSVWRALASIDRQLQNLETLQDPAMRKLMEKTLRENSYQVTQQIDRIFTHFRTTLDKRLRHS